MGWDLFHFSVKMRIYVHSSPHPPVNPGEQRQENLPTLSSQVAPFLQGCEAHSFTSIWQRPPWNPGMQKQEYPSPRGLHMALFWQGFGEQGSTVEGGGLEHPPLNRMWRDYYSCSSLSTINAQFIHNYLFNLLTLKKNLFSCFSIWNQNLRTLETLKVSGVSLSPW